MKRGNYFILILMIVLASGFVSAGNYYVDNNAIECSQPFDTDYNLETRTCGTGSLIVYNTIQSVFDNINLNGGEIIEVRSGTYKEKIIISNEDSGTKGNPVVLKVKKGELVKIDGEKIRERGIEILGGTTDMIIEGFNINDWISASTGDGIYIHCAQNSECQRIILRNNKVNIIQDSSGLGQMAIHFEHCDYCSAENNFITTDDGSWNVQTDGFKIGNSDNIILSNNTIVMRNGWNQTDNHADCLQMMGCANFTAYGNDFLSTKDSSTQGFFLNVPDNDNFVAKDYGINRIYNNIIHGKISNAGIILYCQKPGSSCRYEIYNNIIAQEKTNPDGIGIRISDDYAIVKNNIIWNENARTTMSVENTNQNEGDIDFNLHYSSHLDGFRTNWGGSFYTDINDWKNINGPGNNENKGDPKLDSEFMQTSLSVDVIDKGINLNSIFNTDKKGVARPLEARWDIGAYEFVSDSVTCQPGDQYKIIDSTNIQACTCEQTDVQVAIGAADDGMTVNVPAGSCVWDEQVLINKGIILKGQTSGCPGACIDNTVITSGASNRLIYISVSGDKDIDISGLTLASNSSEATVYIYNSLSIEPLYNLRIHNNNFHNVLPTTEGYTIQNYGMVFGLIDNNHFEGNKRDIGNGGKDAISWTLFPAIGNLGTINYMYIEDNIFNNDPYIILGSGNGGRWVFRHNVANNAYGDGFVEAHGDTKNRGNVAFEVYENNGERGGGKAKFVDYRGGTGIIFNNIIDASSNPGIKVREEHDGCTVSVCDGSDGGDEVQNGYMWNNVDAEGIASRYEESDILSYTSGGTYTPISGDSIIGETSGATTSITATPRSPLAGAWETGDAVGALIIGRTEGTFSFPENLMIGGHSDSATTIKGDYIEEDTSWWDDGDGEGGLESPLNFYYDLSGYRSASCLDDDCYWEIDTRKLYRCDGDDNWIFVYTPYKYPHPLTVAPFGTDICGEGEITTECWCEGLKTTGTCNNGYLSGSSCAHDSDTNCDGKVEISELIAYISRWKNNEGVMISDLMEAINIWKNG
ncbi:MAG: choice-of-anchor Q domain-containing protein [archaeon]